MVQFSFRFVGMGEGAVLVGTGEGAVLVGSFLLSAVFSVITPHVSYVEERENVRVCGSGGSGNTALYSAILTKHPANTRDDGEAWKTATCFLLFKEKCLKPGEVTHIWNTL